MTKAKIFLTALTVLAIAGGALAFKARMPKLFAYCNVTKLKCDLSTFTTFEATTVIAGIYVPYDELNKPCVFDQGIGTYTCKTQVTISE